MVGAIPSSARVVVFAEDRNPSPVVSLVGKVCGRLAGEGAAYHAGSRRVCAAEGPPATAWRGLSWRGRDTLSQNRRRELVNDLRRRLSTGDVVVLHHDADAPWGEESVTASQVADLLTELDRAGVSRENLCCLVPTYSLESWLYLSHTTVERARLPEPQQAQALAWLKENIRQETGYDHVRQPKDRCPLADGLNAELARDLSTARAEAHSPSWRAAVTQLEATPALLALLRSP